MNTGPPGEREHEETLSHRKLKRDNLNLNWVSVAGSPVDLALFATNVTNEYYYVFTPGVGQSAPFEVGQLGEPRMYGIRLKYRFGS